MRMAIDVGEVEARADDYFGPVLNRAGRMLAAAHGRPGAALRRTRMRHCRRRSGGWQAKALGEFRFKGIGSPQHVFQLLLTGFPPTSRPSGSTACPRSSCPVPSVARCGATSSASRSAVATSASSIARTIPRSGVRSRSRSFVRSSSTSPSFVRGFEAEAQLVAQLEHPHLVPLYDYWRDPEGAYLVMRWLRGGLAAAGARARPVEARARLAPGVAGRGRARLRPPPGCRPPRRQAREHPARRGRKRVPLRLRDRRPRGRFGRRGHPLTSLPAYVSARAAVG